ncbi:hypothetical protein AB0L67_25070 [Streptomyces flaveolus]|uniref:hypothetical protein n=1 Tax=Streptomyces flaveolus TaxID=67297 RepID=UPI00343D8B20
MQDARRTADAQRDQEPARPPADLAAVRLKRSGTTVTVSATVLPERAADQAFRRKHFGIDKEGKVDVYVGRGVPVSDYGSLIAAFSRNAGDLYQGPTHLL